VAERANSGEAARHAVAVSGARYCCAAAVGSGGREWGRVEWARLGQAL
jgi:hypothetical protein